jgi:hypothetical protein
MVFSLLNNIRHATAPIPVKGKCDIFLLEYFVATASFSN